MDRIQSHFAALWLKSILRDLYYTPETFDTAMSKLGYLLDEGLALLAFKGLRPGDPVPQPGKEDEWLEVGVIWNTAELAARN